MRCEECGQVSDWIGTESDWTAVGSGGATYPLFQCEVCGYQQRPR